MMNDLEQIGICIHCKDPIYNGEDVIVDDDGDLFHEKCYADYRLDQVSDAYNKEGVAGLKKIEQEDELDNVLGIS